MEHDLLDATPVGVVPPQDREVLVPVRLRHKRAELPARPGGEPPAALLDLAGTLREQARNSLWKKASASRSLAEASDRQAPRSSRAASGARCVSMADLPVGQG